MSSFFDLKAMPLVTSSLSDSTILFGAATGQSETHPDPITAPALVSYLNTKVSGTFLDGLGTPSQGQVPLRGASTWGLSAFLLSGAAGNLQLGLADAAAPVAQTLSVQSVVAGTSNTAGVDWTINGSRGTGTGIGGRIIFQVAPAGSTGTTQNPLSPILTLTPANGGVVQFNFGAMATTNGLFYFLKSGVDSLSGASNYINSSNGNPLILGTSNTDRIQVPSAGGGLILGAADAAAPIAQTLSVQNVVAGTSNVAGANWTLKASASTGNAAGGNFIFLVTQPGSSGTAQNAFTNALTIGAGAGGGRPFFTFGASGSGATSVGVPGNANDQVLNISSNGSALNQGWAFQFGNSASVAIGMNNADSSVGVFLGPPSLIQWSASAAFNAATDTIIGRNGAASVRFGAVDAAAPIAQTLGVQSVIAGTSNTAGANFTIKGSAGTGTGVGGDIVFQATAAGSSGTAQNAFFNILRITPTGGAGASLKVTDPNTGQFVLTSNSNNFGLAGGGFYQLTIIANPATGVAVAADQQFGFSGSNASTNVLTFIDTILTRKAAANFQIGATDAAAPVAQTLSVQSVLAGTSNTAGVNWTFKASAGTGTGAGGNYSFQVAPAGASGTAQNTFIELLGLTGANTINLFNGSARMQYATGLILTSAANSWYFPSTGFTVPGGGTIGFSSNATDGSAAAADTTLARLSQACMKFNGAWGSSAPNTQSGTTYTMVAGDSSLIFSNAATVTVTLLAASSNSGRWLYVKNLGAGTLVSASSNVAPIGSATAGTAILAAGPGKWAVMESDGTNWIIMAAN